MKLYIIDSKGWIGKKYINLCKQEGIEYITSEFRATTDDLLQDIVKRDPSHVISCIGRTHGIRNGKKYSTIDYLEHDDKLSENINDNLFAPLSLAMFCQTIGIHFTYIGTGCIFNYDNNHLLNESSIQGEGYKEIDDPNFIGSKYSLVKGYTDKLMKYIQEIL
jgi:dTDP-4-dehydrorhamnose reductase